MTFFTEDEFKQLLLQITDAETAEKMMKLQVEYFFEIGACHETPTTADTPAAPYIESHIERKFVDELGVSKAVASGFSVLFRQHMNDLRHRQNKAVMH